MKCPDINNQKPMYEKKNLKLLIKKREENKNFKFKQLNFNPVSYFEEKYSKEDKNITNKSNLYEHIAKSNKKENENINYNLTKKRLKLKPLNINKTNRANYNGQLLPKIDDILIPSNKISQELIDYNKANARNTLLNYYNKNKGNRKIINFIKTNSFIQNQNINQTDKIDLSNESIINNNSNSINIPNINNNTNNNNQKENKEKILKGNKNKISFSETNNRENPKRNELRKSRIDAYRFGFLRKRQVQRSLNYFHDFFFGKNISTKPNKNNLLLDPETQLLTSDQISSSTSEQKDFKFNKNNLVFDQLFNQKTRNKRMFKNVKKSTSVKETQSLSLQGYNRMKAIKKRKFEMRLKNASDEAYRIEQKLDELLKMNKLIFQNVEKGL